MFNPQLCAEGRYCEAGKGTARRQPTATYVESYAQAPYKEAPTRLILIFEISQFFAYPHP